jgi:flagellin-like protein
MRRYTSVGLSPLVAVILLIAITVAAAVVVSGVFFNLAGIAGRRPTAIIDQVRVGRDSNRSWVNLGNSNKKHRRRTDNKYCRSVQLPGSCNPVMPAFNPLPLNPGGTASSRKQL